MESISLPNKVSFEKKDGNRSVLVIEPLYPGYGVTIGNALRRVLLSSLPGSAVTAMKIKGVDHEFSSIEGVREDVLDIVLNLKQLRLNVHSSEPVRLQLKADGEGEITAGDIEPNSEVEVINEDLLIATLDSDDSRIDMELIVRQGRGYVPVEMRDDENLEIGMIAVDAVYSPIRNVNFDVENVRVGDITNYDKLTITMETDGTLTGEEALDLASEILVEHFSLLKTGRVEEEEEAQATLDIDTTEKADSETDETAAEESETDAEESEDESDLIELNLSNRSLNALKKNGIKTIDEVRGMSAEELKELDGLGEKSVEEILNALA